MLSNSFTFLCPACGAKLTLPFHLAGVSGPCPSCRTQIQAPTHEALRRHAQSSQCLPAHAAPDQAPQPAQPSSSPPRPQPSAAGSEDARGKPNYKIEPRLLPTRENPAEIVSRPISEVADRPRVDLPYPTPRRRRSHPLKRALIPVLLLCTAAALILGLTNLLTPNPGNLHGDPGKPASGSAAVKPIIPSDPRNQGSHPNDAPPVGVEPAAPAGGPGLAPLVTLRERGNQALETLERFLKASSLAERQPIIESQTSPEELEKSCLAGPLPPASIITQIQESNDLEKVTDCYYSVTFDVPDGPPVSLKMLVRIRGDASPVVVVDPFLDLYGGRLRRFVSDPTLDSGTFQAVISARRFCDDSIPKSESQFTLKIMMDDTSPEAICGAVCAKRSPVGLMYEDSSSGLRWGQPKACTVVLEWDRADPSKPYVRALHIVSTDWNP